MAFNFEPENGLLNTEEFPDKPASGTAARGQFMKLFNQVKDYINGMETKGVKANGGNADTVGGVNPNEFSKTTHNHNGTYATASHSHNYSESNHNHSGVYATASHNHNGTYATASHSHSYTNTSVGGLGTYRWYWKDEKTGLIRQGGYMNITFNNSDTASVTFEFAIPFPNRVQSIIASEKHNSITTRGMFNVACWENDNKSATAQAVVMNLTPRTGNVTVYWEATGY